MGRSCLRGIALVVFLVSSTAGWPQVTGLGNPAEEARFRDPEAAARALRELVTITRDPALRGSYAQELISLLAQRGDYPGALEVVPGLRESAFWGVESSLVQTLLSAATSRGDMAQLQAAARQCTIDHPEDPSGWRLLASAAAREGDTEAALAAHTHLAETWPSAPNRVALAETLKSARRYEEAIRVINEMGNPDVWARLHVVADSLVALGRKAEAEAVADGIAADPTLARHDLIALAGWYKSLGLTDKQIGALERAIPLDPDDRGSRAATRRLLAQAYDQAGQAPQALAAYKQAAEEDDDAARGWLARALPGQVGAPAEFDAILTLILAGDPRERSGSIDQAVSAARREKTLAALITAVEGRVEQAPENAALLELSIAVHRAQGDYAAAAERGRRLLEADPRSQLAYDVATWYGQAAKHQEALDALGKVQWGDWSLDMALLAARSWQALGRPEGIDTLIVDLRALDRGEAWKDCVEGQVWLTVGQADKALPFLERAVEPRPLSEGARMRALARAYRELGRTDDAAALYAEAIARGVDPHEAPGSALALLRGQRPPEEYVPELVVFCARVLAAAPVPPPPAPRPARADAMVVPPPTPPLRPCVELWRQCAEAARVDGKLPGLVEALAQQAQARPQDALVAAALGFAQLASARYEEARQSLEAAGKLEPTGELAALLAPSVREATRWTRPRSAAAARDELQTLLRLPGDDGLARAVVVAASSLAPLTDFDAILRTTRELADQANEAKLLGEFAAAAEARARESDDPAALNLALGCRLTTGPPEKFLEVAAGFGDRLNAMPGWLEAMGSLWGLQGDLEAARQCFSRILALDPNAWQHAIGLAGALARGGQAEEAKAWALKGFEWLQAGGRDPRAAARIAQSLAWQGCSGEARQAAEQAVALAPEDPGVRFSVALAYEKLGLSAEAAAALTAALGLGPDATLRTNIENALARVKGE